MSGLLLSPAEVRQYCGAPDYVKVPLMDCHVSNYAYECACDEHGVHSEVAYNAHRRWEAACNSLQQINAAHYESYLKKVVPELT